MPMRVNCPCQDELVDETMPAPPQGGGPPFRVARARDLGFRVQGLGGLGVQPHS